MMVLQDLLDLAHYLTKVKVSPDVARDTALPEAERVRGASLAQGLSVPVLARAWQMLSKGVVEVQQAPHPQNALEMALIRLMYVSDQPTPGDVLKQLKDGSIVSAGGGVPASSAAPRGTTIMRATSAAAVAQNPISLPEQPQEGVATLHGFDDVVALFGRKKAAVLQGHLMGYVHVVKFEQGHIALRLKDGAPQNLIGQMTEKLQEWTGMRWIVSLSREAGAPTFAERSGQNRQAALAETRAHPVVAEILREFPGAQIVDIRDKKP
jgi:DNA polymerase-3 subunit gamma/tau